MHGKKFVASYSGGKDSILAIYRAIKLGMIPLGLINTYNIDKNRSWFHGIPKHLLNQVSASIGIPITYIKTSGVEYAANFEKELVTQKEAGAQVCIFGDIDLEEHLVWCTQRCENVGLEAYFPLWQNNRRDLVNEFIDSNFVANITVIDKSRLAERYLGAQLTKELVDAIVADGADACGENGEYHTFVSNGPLFSRPIAFNLAPKIYFDNYAIIPIS